VSDDTLRVELVAADRLVWSGDAKVVNARTVGGEIGILANHMPVLSLLEAGVVEVETVDGEKWLAAVDDGFLSVAGNHVSILASHAEMATDIDLEAARRELDRARGEGDEQRQGADVRRHEARVGRLSRLPDSHGVRAPPDRITRAVPQTGAALAASVASPRLSPSRIGRGGTRDRCRYGNGCWTQLLPCCS